MPAASKLRVHTPAHGFKNLHVIYQSLDRNHGSTSLHLGRAAERSQVNTVFLLNRETEQTVGVVNKQKTNSWGGEQTHWAWSSHPDRKRPCFGKLRPSLVTQVRLDDHH